MKVRIKEFYANTPEMKEFQINTILEDYRNPQLITLESTSDNTYEIMFQYEHESKGNIK